MQRITVEAVILSLARGTLAGVFGLLLLADTVWSETFDNFRFVGLSTIPTGTVTSLSMDINAGGNSGDAGQLSYFDASGLSTVFTLTIRPSAVVNGQTTVRVQGTGSFDTMRLQDLHELEFYTGELSHDSAVTPPNWFRLSHYQGVWSGVFRVGSQVYTLPRTSMQGNPLQGATAADVVEVRSTLSTTSDINPSHRAKVSAVFNTGYFEDGSFGPANRYLAALESIHVSDGLLADSLGLTLQLEQIVVANVFDTVDATDNGAVNGAVSWVQNTRSAIGTDDNLATLFFVEPTANTDSEANGASVAMDEAIILQPYSDSEYPFSTAYSFGTLFGLGTEADTLQDWRYSDLVALPVVHWSQQQRQTFYANTSLAGLLQSLPNDQPDTNTQALPVPPELDQVLVESDSEERLPLAPQDDSATINSTATGGGGSAVWLFLMSLLFLRQRHPKVAR